MTGAAWLPGLDSTSAARASLPWGLRLASREEGGWFLDLLGTFCASPSSPAVPSAPALPAAVSATEHTRTDPPRAAFLGRTTLNTLSNPEPFEGAVLRMVLDDCGGDALRIPFLVGSDRSRTWVLEFEGEALRLAHDHRDADGVAGEANFYGGVGHRAAGDEGSGRQMEEGGREAILYFPADPRTVDDRPARAANAWAMALSPDGSRFFYRLYLNGALRLEAAFDLTRTVPVTPDR